MSKFIFFTFFLLQITFSYAQHDTIQLISWNIKDFGRTKDSFELERIAEITKDADIIAIQEVVAGYGGAQAVAKLSDILNRKGAKWDYIVSNPTKSSKYLTERYAYIWKTKHIKIKNRGQLIDSLKDVIEREPHAVDFYLRGKKFTVLNYHSIPFSKNPRDEITALTNYIMNTYTTPVLLAGDFNMQESDLVFERFVASGYTPAVKNTKTTIKRVCNNGTYLNYAIDNIYFSKGISKIKSSVIDFVLACSEIEAARKLSDHLPVSLTFCFK